MNLDGYEDHGVLAAVELVNELTRETGLPKAKRLAAIAKIIAVDPPVAAQLRERDLPGFTALAKSLREVFAELHDRRVDKGAAMLNDLLARHDAHPCLAKEKGRWRLHHHPVEAALVPMYTAICAEGLARMVGAGHADRFGVCDAPGCDRVFFDVSKNASRRFCSTTCQNRVKAGTFRMRNRS